MKRSFCALLALALLCLCACGEAVPATETTTIEATTTEITTTETTTEVPSTVEIKTGEGDPYSYVIKAYYECELSGYKKTNEELVQGFEILENSDISTASWWGETQYYALYDIDKNGTKELLLGVYDVEEKMVLFDLYTIQDGIAVEQLCVPVPTRYSMGIDKNGTVYMSHLNQDNPFGFFWGIDFHRFKNGQLQFCEAVMVYRHGTQTTYETSYTKITDWQEGEIEITEKEYNAINKKYEGEEIELDWRPLSQYKANA